MKTISEILIVASTKFELNQIISQFIFSNKKDQNISSYIFKNLNIDVLISGIGIPSTTYKLTKALSIKKYDLVINVGICGSFNNNLIIGKLVNVIEDQFADIGLTDVNNNFISLFDEGFVFENEFPFKNKKIISPTNYILNVANVTGITVNTSSGNAEQIKIRKQKFNADIETMEGAAVGFVCLLEKVDFMQIRAISNMVEPRNKNNWNIPLAIENLSNLIVDFLANLSS